jgi:predicted dehydrogenase
MSSPFNVGIIGCGNIAPQYFKGCAPFGILNVTACADLDFSRAEARAAEYGIRALTVDDLLADPDIQIVINLTVPAAHASVNMAILEAGKHAYTEKPFALTRTDGQRQLALAAEKGLSIGCAPDTFLGGGGQTCRKLIDDGVIGKPIAAVAFFAGHGMEMWHPDPDFFYKRGGGPMLDMGPYYLTALVNLMGPMRRIAASTKITFPERLITSQPRNGQKITVETPTHITGVVDFANGATATLITSFDVWSHHLPRIEIYGTEGSLAVPDPNGFGGPVYVRRASDQDWSEVPLTHSAEVGRGIGVADMAYSIRTGRPARATGALALHVLDAMLAFEESSNTGAHIHLESRVSQPAPLPVGLPVGELD